MKNVNARKLAMIIFLNLVLVLSNTIITFAKNWIMPPSSIINFTDRGISLSTLPTAIYGNVANGAFDQNGNLLFYIGDSSIYDRNGNFVDSLYVTGEEICIVPISSDIYYIIYSVPQVMGPGYIYYSEVSVSGSTVQVLKKNIRLESYYYETSGFAVSKMLSSQRFLYVVGPFNEGIDKYIISSTGITFSQTIYTPADFFGFFFDQVNLSSDGTKLAWCEYNILHLIMLNSEGNFVSRTDYTLPSNDSFGCEFSPDGNKIYVSTNNGIYVYDLTQTTPTYSLIPGSSSFQSQLELGADGKIYGTSPTNMCSIDPVTGVFLTYAAGYPVSFGNTLPDQIDGEDNRQDTTFSYYREEITSNPTVSGNATLTRDTTSLSFKGNGNGSGSFSWGPDTNYKIVWRARCTSGNFVLDGHQLPVTTTGWSQEYSTYGRTISWSSSSGNVEIDYVIIYQAFAWLDQGENTANPTCSGYGGVAYNAQTGNFEGSGGSGGALSWGTDQYYKIVWRARCPAGYISIDGHLLPVTTTAWSPEYTTYGRTLTWSGPGSMEIDYIRVYYQERLQWTYLEDISYNPSCTGDGPLNWNSYTMNFSGIGNYGSGSFSWGASPFYSIYYKINWRGRCTSGNFKLDGSSLPVTTTSWSPEYFTLGRTLTWSASPSGNVEIDYVTAYILQPAKWLDEGETTVNPVTHGTGGCSWDTSTQNFRGGGYQSGDFTWGSGEDYKLVWRGRCISNNFMIDGHQLPLTTTGWSPEYTTYGRTLRWSSNLYGDFEIDYIHIYKSIAGTWVYLGETTENPSFSGLGGIGWIPSTNNFSCSGYGGGGISWGSDQNYKIVWRARCTSGGFSLDYFTLPLTTTSWSPEYTSYGRTLGWSSPTSGYAEIDYVKVYHLE